MTPPPRTRARPRAPAAVALLNLVVASTAGVTGCRGCGPSSPDPAPPAQGKWFAERYRTHRFDEGLTDAQREQMAALEALGYADGTQAGPGGTSVVRHDRARAWQGLNFYSSGHGPEAVLVDMDGRELHRWHHEFWDAFPRYPVEAEHGSTNNFRRAWLLGGGDVFAIHEGLGAVRLDAASRLLWANPGRIHHDADFAPDGTILTLARVARVLPRIDPTRPVFEDLLVFLDPATGREKDELSLLEALEQSPWAARFAYRPDRPDLFHTNTVLRLDGRAAGLDPAFAEGNVLVSLRNLDLVAVVDPVARQVVWASTGPFRLQHDPSITAALRLMVFDNLGARPDARVLQLSLPAGELLWQWAGPPDAPLRSPTLGTAQELPNGDLLVTESEGGRALELDPESGDVVWEFHNPHRAGPAGEYVAALFEVIRYPADTDVTWAKGAPTAPRGARLRADAPR